MPILQSIGETLQNTPVGSFISESTWAFPTIESIHVFFLVLVVGSIFIVDLRLVGLTSKNRKVSELSNEVLPITWTAFCGALITGGLLFTSKAVEYLNNWPFRIKMALLALAGINMLLFHFLTYSSVKKWDGDVVTPQPARVAGFLSLTFWVLVVVFGRWIGFTIR